MVMKLLIKCSSENICCRNVHHKTKLVSIFSTNILLQETNSSPGLPACWRRVCSGEKSEVLYVMSKIRIEWNKAGKGIDLKLYNVTFNI